MTNTLCDQVIEAAVKQAGRIMWYVNRDCPHKSKYEVRFRQGTNGKFVTRKVCGKHLIAIQKNCKRLKEKMDWDSKLTINPI